MEILFLNGSKEIFFKKGYVSTWPYLGANAMISVWFIFYNKFSAMSWKKNWNPWILKTPLKMLITPCFIGSNNIYTLIFLNTHSNNCLSTTTEVTIYNLPLPCSWMNGDMAALRKLKNIVPRYFSSPRCFFFQIFYKWP